MLSWCLLGIAGTKLAALELLLAPSRCRSCPVEALCSTRLFARRLHPKQAEYGIFNHAQKRIHFFSSWKNKPLKGIAGGESTRPQRGGTLQRRRGWMSLQVFLEWGVQQSEE